MRPGTPADTGTGYAEVVARRLRPIVEAAFDVESLVVDERASCRRLGLGAEVFHPTQGGSVRLARAACASCPLRTECAALGMAAAALPQRAFGVWGGTGADRRARLLRELHARVNAGVDFDENVEWLRAEFAELVAHAGELCARELRLLGEAVNPETSPRRDGRQLVASDEEREAWHLMVVLGLDEVAGTEVGSAV